MNMEEELHDSRNTALGLCVDQMTHTLDIFLFVVVSKFFAGGGHSCNETREKSAVAVWINRVASEIDCLQLVHVTAGMRST